MDREDDVLRIQFREPVANGTYLCRCTSAGRWIAMTRAPKNDEQYSDEEAARRTEELICHSFAMPHKPLKQIVGTTPRAKAMARRKAAKGSPKSK